MSQERKLISEPDFDLEFNSFERLLIPNQKPWSWINSKVSADSNSENTKISKHSNVSNNGVTERQTPEIQLLE